MSAPAPEVPRNAPPLPDWRRPSGWVPKVVSISGVTGNTVRQDRWIPEGQEGQTSVSPAFGFDARSGFTESDHIHRPPLAIHPQLGVHGKPVNPVGIPVRPVEEFGGMAGRQEVRDNNPDNFVFERLG